jgi:hypothetical protein
VTEDVTPWTTANFLSEVGKRTPMFARFSTVAGELGSPDTVRDPRGFALRFYTEEGNYDLVGNNTPVFFIRTRSRCRSAAPCASACASATFPARGCTTATSSLTRTAG